MKIFLFILFYFLNTTSFSAQKKEVHFPITLRGGSDQTFFPKLPLGKPIVDSEKYDVIIVGGGLSGLTAALYLSDYGKKVLIIEKEESIGGVAFGGINSEEIPFNRGGAYWSDPFDEEEKILNRFGMGNFQEINTISEPIDSYFWKGQLYLGLWEQETLEKLPSSFALFKHELELADKEGLIPNQPFEEGNLELDAMSASEWIRKMPSQISQRKDETSQKVYKKFLNDKSLDPNDPMKDVTDLMVQYGRSALGSGPDDISAAAFANFYISEITTRYSSPFGTGEASRRLGNLLKDRPHLVKIKTGGTVINIKDDENKVILIYLLAGKTYLVRSDYAIFAAQLALAPIMIEGLSTKDPQRTKIIQNLTYSHYVTHVVNVKGHPFRATYDTWFRPSDWTPEDFTDVILGRWMDPAIDGYKEYRDFKKNPNDENGILTIYHPFLHEPAPQSKIHKNIKKHIYEIAKKAVNRLLTTFNPLLEKEWKSKIEVKSVESNLWPYSIHIVKPGYFKNISKTLRKPFGRIMFANNNIGTPSFEEALYRGHCAANNILYRFNKEFKQEPWTQCTLE